MKKLLLLIPIVASMFIMTGCVIRPVGEVYVAPVYVDPYPVIWVGPAYYGGYHHRGYYRR